MEKTIKNILWLSLAYLMLITNATAMNATAMQLKPYLEGEPKIHKTITALKNNTSYQVQLKTTAIQLPYANYITYEFYPVGINWVKAGNRVEKENEINFPSGEASITYENLNDKGWFNFSLDKSGRQDMGKFSVFVERTPVEILVTSRGMREDHYNGEFLQNDTKKQWTVTMYNYNITVIENPCVQENCNLLKR